ncbi:MAG: class I SAM-dependent methyltransferase [Vulcanimicrobiaceae bacterium]
MADESLGAAYFARVYAHSDDPWNFETSPYEAEKYAATLAALPRARYARALEIGCSIGVLTARLAARCDELVAIDIDPHALDLARERCRTLGGVRFERSAFPAEAPAGDFELFVVSEVAYYWSDRDLERARARIVASAPGGTVVLVHFTPVVADYVRTGDAVHEIFLGDARFAHIAGARAERYRLDVLRVS